MGCTYPTYYGQRVLAELCQRNSPGSGHWQVLFLNPIWDYSFAARFIDDLWVMLLAGNPLDPHTILMIISKLTPIN